MPLPRPFPALRAHATPLLAVAALAGVIPAAPASADVRVAFTGDQGVGENARSVLRLIADEGTDLLLIQGDLGYNDDSAVTWESHLREALGRDFPVLTLVGNHENFEWPRYRRFIEERVGRVPGLSCEGETGVKATCRFENLDIVQVAPAIYEVDGIDAEDDYAAYIRDAFEGPADGRWRLCAWHKNMNAMQSGDGHDSTGWDVFDACLDAGALVAMAHEHAYSRTHLLDDYRTQSVVHTDPAMRLEPGRSFAFVSGLGGREVGAQVRGGDHFGSIYTATQGATHGALFCDFGESRADCRFKTVDGAVPDRFTLSIGAPAPAPAPEPEPDLASESPRPIEPRSPARSTQRYPTSFSRRLSSAPATAGFVFERSDSDEYRWIEPDVSGELGSIWIDADCAARMGGPAERGDWEALLALAPGFDTASYPCRGVGHGHVFARTDKVEYRWIDRDSRGRGASAWIDAACARRLGGPTARGDWGDLMDSAPRFDAIDAPCD